MSLLHYTSAPMIPFPPIQRGYHPPNVHTNTSMSSPSSWLQYNSKPSDDLATECLRGSPTPWHTQLSPSWSMQPPGSPSFRGVDDTVTHPTAAFFAPPEYPESSQRTVLRPSSSSPSPRFSSSAPQDKIPLHHPANSFQPNHSGWPAHKMYILDDPEPRGDHPLPSPSPSVKLEPDDSDDCFIMEFSTPSSPTLSSQELVPRTAVPLRATQASKEMRKMMGVFRLNPFTMHSSGGRGVSASWYGEDIGPLEEDPLMFEFQLELDGLLVPSEDDEPRSLSSDFTPEEDGEYQGTSGDSPRTLPEMANSPVWQDSYTDGVLSSDPVAYEDVSNNYSAAAPSYGNRSAINHHSLSPIHPGSSENRDFIGDLRPPSWPPGGYMASSRSGSFISTSDTGVDVAPCLSSSGVQSSHPHSGELPSLAAMARRWSLPNANPQAPFLL